MTETIEIVRCRDCKHWNHQIDNFMKYHREDPNKIEDYDTGICAEINEGIEINLSLGWDGGYVENVETDANFFCPHGKNK